MTDLEMTKACAEAMGYTTQETVWDSRDPNSRICVLAHDGITGQQYYDPFYQDAQAMALVKKFRLRIGAPLVNYDGKQWWVGWPHEDEGSVNADLNRAIIECVAAKQPLQGTVK